MSIVPLNVGTEENDGTGQNLRSGGIVINANFAELDQRTTQQQAVIDQKIDKASGLGLSQESFTTPEKTKLSGVASGATANASDAQLRDRSTHTGTQLSTTISDFVTAVSGALLTGLSLTAGGVIVTTDTLLAALGKLQKQVTDLGSSKLDTTANAVSATKLATARTINGVAFDGTANINFPSSTVAWGGVSGTLTDQTDLAAALNGKLAVGGTAGAATKLAAARKINGIPFDGSSDITISGAGAVWGGVTGALKDQADLKLALDAKLSSVGGSLTGPVLSTSTAKFTGIELTETSGTIITGGVPHSAVGTGAAISIAKDDALVSEFMSCSTAARFNIHRARGTISAPTIVADNDTMGYFQFLAHNGSAYYPAGAFSCVIDGAPAAGGPVPGRIQFTTGDASGTKIAWQMRSAGHLQPGADNAYDLGAASLRSRVIYAGTGAISTSDAREKAPVRTLATDELAAAKQLAGEIGAYRFLSAINEKGFAAREHIGMTVQRAIEVMQAHDLDPFNYGFICHDTWDERVDLVGGDDGQEPVEVKTPAGDRYSFRVDELCLFIAAGFEARLAALEKTAS